MGVIPELMISEFDKIKAIYNKEQNHRFNFQVINISKKKGIEGIDEEAQLES